jgi:hypothetical protein
MKNLPDTGIDNVFFLEKSCGKMYTIFSAVQRQHRKSDVMTSFCLTACSAVYYHAGSSLEESNIPQWIYWLGKTNSRPGRLQAASLPGCSRCMELYIIEAWHVVDRVCADEWSK